MDIKDIHVGDKVTFRTVKMDTMRPDHAGKVVAIAETAKGAWVEIQTSDRTLYRTRAACVFKAS